MHSISSAFKQKIRCSQYWKAITWGGNSSNLHWNPPKTYIVILWVSLGGLNFNSLSQKLVRIGSIMSYMKFNFFIQNIIYYLFYAPIYLNHNIYKQKPSNYLIKILKKLDFSPLCYRVIDITMQRVVHSVPPFTSM